MSNFVNITNKVNSFLLSLFMFTIIFISLFGPKDNFLDFSLVASYLGFFLLLSVDKFKVTSEYIVIVLLCMGYCIYSLLIFIFLMPDEYQPILRAFRALFSTIALGFIFSNIRCDLNKLLNIYVLALLIHAIAIISVILMPEIRPFLDTYTGYTGKILPIRSCGLLSGYDSAGFLCLLGVILSFSMFVFKGRKGNLYLFSLLIFLMAIFLTGRFSIVLGIMLNFFILAYLLFKGSIKLKVISPVILFMFVLTFVNFVLPLFTSIDQLAEYVGHYESSIDFSKSYGVGGYDALTERMWIFPDSFLGLLFGLGIDPPVDIGYVRILFMVGIVGFTILLGTYIYVGVKSYKIFRTSLNHTCNRFTNVKLTSIKVASCVMLMLIVLIFIFNVKLLFFHSRIFYELMIILFFSTLRSYKDVIRANGVFYKQG